MDIRTYEEIEDLDTEWLWAGRLPYGDVTILAGDNGVGKSFLTCDLTARVTTGAPMPGEDEGGPPGSVILITPEDVAETTLAKRLRFAGADPSKVIDLTTVVRSGGQPGDEGFMLPEDLPILARTIAEKDDVRLVVIDPISAVSGDTQSVRRVRQRLIGPLQSLARETGVAILIIGHPTKGMKWAKTAAELKEAVAGSKGLTDAARVVHVVIRDESDPELRQLYNVKNNLDREAEVLEYTIGGDEEEPRVIWTCEATEDMEQEAATEEGAEEVTPEQMVAYVVSRFEEAGRYPTAQEVAKITGLGYLQTRVALKHLEQEEMSTEYEEDNTLAAGVKARLRKR